MTNISVKKIPFTHSSRLHYLFNQALEKDFLYFSTDYRRNVSHANSRSKIRLGIIHPKRLFLGLYDSSELKGYSMSGVIPKSNQAFLYWLYIEPALRKQHHGQILLEQTENELKSRNVDSISLVTHNHHQFYERAGYDLKKILTSVDRNVNMYLMTKNDL